MAVAVQTASYVALNAVDESAYVSKVALMVNGEEVNITTMSSAGWKTLLGGLKSFDLSLDLFTDFAASTLDSRLWALHDTVTTFEIRPSNAAVSTANPKYTGSVLVKTVTPLDVEPGQVSKISVTWPGTGALTRATA